MAKQWQSLYGSQQVWSEGESLKVVEESENWAHAA